MRLNMLRTSVHRHVFTKGEPWAFLRTLSADWKGPKSPAAIVAPLRSFSSDGGNTDNDDTHSKYTIPRRSAQKIVSITDACELVRSGDTLTVSGFVTQGSPEAVLQCLGERFDADCEPKDLTLIFGGGPGNYGTRGLSHLAKEKKMSDGTEVCMLKRTIGGHYGQVPKIAELALLNKIEAWTLPMGSISRMIRAQSTHSPGHVTNIGLGTYCDPDDQGGAANEAAKASPLHSHLVTKIEINGQTCLVYKALPIDVAIIRGTTADAQGNITIEQESLRCDQKIIAAASKNSGGIVIAQVKRIAAKGSLRSRQIEIPGSLVDCVVVVDEKDHDSLHGMSYFTKNSPALTGELTVPTGEVPVMSLDIRKMIARRAFFELRPNQVVNLGIGLPEGVASIAAEEKMLEYLTLTTEPGSFGGLPASGHDFGPAYNATSLMVRRFSCFIDDFYVIIKHDTYSLLSILSLGNEPNVRLL